MLLSCDVAARRVVVTTLMRAAVRAFFADVERGSTLRCYLLRDARSAAAHARSCQQRARALLPRMRGALCAAQAQRRSPARLRHAQCR